MPAAVFYFGLSSSLAAGTALVSLVLLVLGGSGSARALLPSSRWQVRVPSSGYVVLAAACILGLLGAHFVVAGTRGPVDWVRGAASLPLLGLMILAASTLARRLASTSESSLRSGAIKSFAILCVVALVGSTGLGPPTLLEPWRAPIFPFSEPSAFALAFVPLMLFACVSVQGSRRLALMLVALVCSGAVQSLTLVCGVLLVALVTLRPFALALAGGLVAAALSLLDLSYLSARLDLSGEGTNLSNLVYIQGWQMIAEAWENSGGYGLGFQQLGVQGTEVPAAQVLRLLRDGEDMNLLDGSFVLVKLGADFGAIGLALAALYVLLALRSALILRRVSSGRLTYPWVLVLAHCVVLAFGIELFVRSPGYLTGTGLLFMASLWLLAGARAVRGAPIWPKPGSIAGP